MHSLIQPKKSCTFDDPRERKVDASNLTYLFHSEKLLKPRYAVPVPRLILVAQRYGTIWYHVVPF